MTVTVHGLGFVRDCARTRHQRQTEEACRFGPGPENPARYLELLSGDPAPSRDRSRTFQTEGGCDGNIFAAVVT